MKRYEKVVLIIFNFILRERERERESLVGGFVWKLGG